MLDQNHQDQIVAKFDTSWVQARMHDSVNQIEFELLRPFNVLKPKIFRDGDKWCALYGVDLMEGVSGFGDSPEEASRDFDKSWNQRLTGGN